MRKNRARILFILLITIVLFFTLGFSVSILGELTIQNNSSMDLKIKVNRNEGKMKDKFEYKLTEEFVLPSNESITIKQFEGMNTFKNHGFVDIIDFIIYNENNEEIKNYKSYEIHQFSEDTYIRKGGALCSLEKKIEYYTFIITDEILRAGFQF